MRVGVRQRVRTRLVARESRDHDVPRRPGHGRQDDGGQGTPRLFEEGDPATTTTTAAVSCTNLATIATAATIAAATFACTTTLATLASTTLTTVSAATVSTASFRS